MRGWIWSGKNLKKIWTKSNCRREIEIREGIFCNKERFERYQCNKELVGNKSKIRKYYKKIL